MLCYEKVARKYVKYDKTRCFTGTRKDAAVKNAVFCDGFINQC